MAQSGGAKKRKRRERDRPKAGPDASYNPNKRVLLSYASDDGESEALELDQPAATGHPQAIEAVTSNYQIPTYRDDDEQSVGQEDESTIEPVKLAEDGDDNLDAKDVKQEEPKNDSLWTRGVTRDVDTGQWPALGALSYEQDEDEQDEQDSETEQALAYLRGVRSERQNLPAFFAAPAITDDEELYGSGVGDSRGYFSEGTYIGRPDIGPIMPESAKSLITAQEAYTRCLKQRFLQQRQQMHVEPGAASLAGLSEKHPTTFDGSESACAQWRKLLQETVPLPAQIRAIDEDTVYRLLGLIQKSYLTRCTEIPDVVSVWIWSLLGRLDDVGTMNNDEAYMVREFAKRAVLVQLSFQDPAVAKQLESMGMDAETSSPGREDENATGDVAPKEHRGDPPAHNDTLITLDIIITIVGDVFGQRDLLEFRREWKVEDDEIKQTVV